MSRVYESTWITQCKLHYNAVLVFSLLSAQLVNVYTLASIFSSTCEHVIIIVTINSTQPKVIYQEEEEDSDEEKG